MEGAEIDVDELEQHLADGATLLDVRESDEYAEAHIDGARPVPLSTVPDNLATFAGSEPIYVICAKGGRSARAVEFLREHDIDAINVAGGMNAWLDAAKPASAGPRPV